MNGRLRRANFVPATPSVGVNVAVDVFGTSMVGLCTDAAVGCDGCGLICSVLWMLSVGNLEVEGPSVKGVVWMLSVGNLEVDGPSFKGLRTMSAMGVLEDRPGLTEL